MVITKILLTALVLMVVITLVQWFFIGYLFHKYQALTPATWRKESYRSYAVSTVLTFFASLLFAWIFSIWKLRCGTMGTVDGIKFGLVCSLAFIIPSAIGDAIYVNLSPKMVAGKCLSSLVEYGSAGAIAVWML